jgi:hypothetical protein
MRRLVLDFGTGMQSGPKQAVTVEGLRFRGRGCSQVGFHVDDNVYIVTDYTLIGCDIVITPV